MGLKNGAFSVDLMGISRFPTRATLS